MISEKDDHPRRTVGVLDSEISFVDTGTGDPAVFLHGNPTSSYLWRNIIPHVHPFARCLAPDLIGMGNSGRIKGCTYRFVDHARYLDAWFEALALHQNVTLVVHDWGSALGFHWAKRHPEAVKALVYMEAIVQPFNWSQWPEKVRLTFKALRSPLGHPMVLWLNLFIEKILPMSVIRDMTKAEMDAYRRPFLRAGESRRPMLTWPREIPIEGKPEDVHNIVDEYSHWMASNDIPKLFVNAKPGAILRGGQRDFCRTWKNQQEVSVNGIHFVQEDAPDEIGAAIADFLRSL